MRKSGEATIPMENLLRKQECSGSTQKYGIIAKSDTDHRAGFQHFLDELLLLNLCGRREALFSLYHDSFSILYCNKP